MAVIASVTGLNVAQPDLAVAFGASQHAILWIINAYTLTLAALLLPLGAVGDRWAASACCSSASSCSGSRTWRVPRLRRGR
jgi:MFS family permease